MTSKPSPRHRGQRYEQVAERYLRAQGLTLIVRNYHARCGEIDLIMREHDTLVFIEVRFRDSISHGSPLATISRQKQQKIIRTAKLYMLQRGLYNKVSCRFDALGIHHDAGALHVNWQRNAFLVE